MRSPKRRDPDEFVKRLIRIYREPGEGDGVNPIRGLIAVAGFWVVASLLTLGIVYTTFELFRH